MYTVKPLELTVVMMRNSRGAEFRLRYGKRVFDQLRGDGSS